MMEYQPFMGTFSGVIFMFYLILLKFSGYNYFGETLAIETKRYDTYHVDTETGGVYVGKDLVKTKVYTR